MRNIPLIIPLLLFLSAIAVVGLCRALGEHDDANRLAWEALTSRRLSAKRAAFDVDGLPLAEAVKRLSEATGVPIVADWPDLEASGVDARLVVHLHLKNVNSRTALDAILDQAGSPRGRLTYEISGGVVRVASQAERRARAVLEVYDLSDLVFVRASRAGERSKTLSELLADIAMLICETVEPDSWEGAGGRLGCLHWAGKRLVILQSEANHRQIARLLEQLRETKSVRTVEHDRLRARLEGGSFDW